MIVKTWHWRRDTFELLLGLQRWKQRNFLGEKKVMLSISNLHSMHIFNNDYEAQSDFACKRHLPNFKKWLADLFFFSDSVFSMNAA